MTYQEEVVRIAQEQASLMAILARPHMPHATGVVVLVGGPQYRVGSHRQFVGLARTLAAAGFAVLRFDFQGIGDSEGAPTDFTNTAGDIAAAIRTLQDAVPEIRNIALWGLCDGASAALLYWQRTQDCRITALCLANPWVRTEVGLAHTRLRHYYLQRLMQAAFWRKLLRGGVRASALQALSSNLYRTIATSQSNADHATFQALMGWSWAHFSGSILLLLSEHDLVAREFIHHATHDPAWRGSLQRAGLVRHDVMGADHTFSSATASQRVVQLTLNDGLLHPGKGP